MQITDAVDVVATIVGLRIERDRAAEEYDFLLADPCASETRVQLMTRIAELTTVIDKELAAAGSSVSAGDRS